MGGGDLMPTLLKLGSAYTVSKVLKLFTMMGRCRTLHCDAIYVAEKG